MTVTSVVAYAIYSAWALGVMASRGEVERAGEGDSALVLRELWRAIGTLGTSKGMRHSRQRPRERAQHSHVHSVGEGSYPLLACISSARARNSSSAFGGVVEPRVFFLHVTVSRSAYGRSAGDVTPNSSKVACRTEASGATGCVRRGHVQCVENAARREKFSHNFVNERL